MYVNLFLNWDMYVQLLKFIISHNAYCLENDPMLEEPMPPFLSEHHTIARTAHLKCGTSRWFPPCQLKHGRHDRLWGIFIAHFNGRCRTEARTLPKATWRSYGHGSTNTNLKLTNFPWAEARTRYKIAKTVQENSAEVVNIAPHTAQSNKSFFRKLDRPSPSI